MTPVDRFLAGLGTRPWSWDGRSPDGITMPRYRNRDEALTYALIEPSNPASITGIGMDIDHPEARTLWATLGLPQPSLIIINPANGHAHYWFQFEKPVMRHKEAVLAAGNTSRAWRYFQAIRYAMRVSYQCDADYSERLIKNPLHAKWEVVVGCVTPYALGDFYSHPVIRANMKRGSHKVVEDSRGRNCSIFRSAMVWVTQNKGRITDHAVWREGITDAVYTVWRNLKHDSGPLDEWELKHIINSVFKYATNAPRKLDNYRQRGVVDVSTAETVADRQRLGQAYTARVRVEKSLDRLLIAYEELVNTVGKVNKVELARLAKVSLSTVYRLWLRLITAFRLKLFNTSGRSACKSTNSLLGQHLKHPMRNPYPPVIAADDPMGIEDAKRLWKGIFSGEIRRFDIPITEIAKAVKATIN